MVKTRKVGTAISILIPALLTLLIINFVYEIIPTNFQGIPVFLPMFFCPFGIYLASISYKLDKGIWSKIGIIFNAIVFFTPFVWMIGGTILFGP
ncbi:MAG: hypothetical protein K6T88_12990 [Bacillus sp. (in: Bacteria)]|nr:hypothetical protein [Bacillus sp. (in: firmicutes)]